MSIINSPFSVHKASLSDVEAVAAYESVLDQVRHASPFLSTPAARAAASAYDLGGSIWLVFDEDDSPVAGLIAYEKKRGPFIALALPPLVPISEPILAAPLRETDIHARRTALDALLDALPYDQETLALGPRWTDVRPFQWAGWKMTPRYTYWVNLDSDPFENWSRSPRRQFQRGREDYNVQEDPNAISEAIRMMRESYKRNGNRFKTPSDSIQCHAEAMITAGLARCFTTVNKSTQTLGAAVVVALNETVAHSWFGGSAPGSARTVTYGDSLPELAHAGIEILDLTGANVSTIAEFKRQFGGTLVQGYRARRVTHPLLRVVEGFRK